MNGYIVTYDYDECDKCKQKFFTSIFDLTIWIKSCVFRKHKNIRLYISLIDNPKEVEHLKELFGK